MGSNDFGNYLRNLIKQAGMTQTQFYIALGITKPYFYDLLTRKVSPPPPKLQFKCLNILDVDEKTSAQFLDLAAKARGEIPADVANWMNAHPEVISNIRNCMSK